METMTNAQFKTFMRSIIDDLTEIKDIASEEIKSIIYSLLIATESIFSRISSYSRRNAHYIIIHLFVNVCEMMAWFEIIINTASIPVIK